MTIVSGGVGAQRTRVRSTCAGRAVRCVSRTGPGYERSGPPSVAPERSKTMGIGASIFLLALGAILTFALDVKVGWLDLDAVGWILMAAGAFGLVLTAL